MASQSTFCDHPDEPASNDDAYKVAYSPPEEEGAEGFPTSKPLKIGVFQKKVPPVFITGKIREL